MSKLGNLMNQLSQESSTSEALSSMVDADEMVEELIDAEVEINSVSETAEEAAEEFENIGDAVESLESSIRHINGLVEKGIGLEGSVFSQWQNSVITSMESFSIPEEVYSLEMDSVKLSFENSQSDDYSTEAFKAIGKTIKKLWDMFVTALARAKEWFIRLISRYTDSGKRLVKAGEALGKKATEYRGHTAKGEITATGYKVLADASGRIDPNKALVSNIAMSQEMHAISNNLFGLIGNGVFKYTPSAVVKPSITLMPGNRIVKIQVENDGNIVNSRSVRVAVEHGTHEIKMPAKMSALDANQVITVAANVVNAGEALNAIKGLADRMNRLKIKTLDQDTTADELVKANACLSISLRILTSNDDSLLLTARKAYQCAVASLKQIAREKKAA